MGISVSTDIYISTGYIGSTLAQKIFLKRFPSLLLFIDSQSQIFRKLCAREAEAVDRWQRECGAPAFVSAQLEIQFLQFLHQNLTQYHNTNKISKRRIQKSSHGNGQLRGGGE